MTMNPATSLRSIRSIREKSDRSGKTTSVATAVAEELDFEEFITQATKTFTSPVSIFVSKEYTQKYVPKTPKPLLQAKKSKSRRMNVVFDTPDSTTTETETDLVAPSQPLSIDHSLTIVARYDAMEFLVELFITKFVCQPIPRILMQLIYLVIGKYQELTKFTIKNCCIDPYTIHELSKIIPASVITDICLDGCPLPEGNYDSLLNQKSCLNNLSLCGCKINDDVCELISTRLYYTEPAEEHLIALNLSSNDITDVGAKHLANALRSNRKLRYLNLGNNHLSDEGAMSIFDILMEFPLTTEEVMDKRDRYMLYLKKKQTLYYECLQKLEQTTPVRRRSGSSHHKPPSTAKTSRLKKEKPKRSSGSSQSSQTQVKMSNFIKAEIMATELLGHFKDPFNNESVTISNWQQYCVGNFVLCYLNVAYNNLTYMSVKKLLSVVEYQQSQRTPEMFGLINVLLDGNYIPESCVELSNINHILQKHIAACYNIKQPGDRRKSYAKTK